MRDKSTGRDCDPVFVPRKWMKFQIGPNSHPRKVRRWMSRHGLELKPAMLERAAARHVHPRHKSWQNVADPTICAQEVITDQAPPMQCAGPFGEQAISKWMGENIHYRTGWRLAKWGCAVGYQKRTPI